MDTAPNTSKSSWWRPEFVLVVFMLIILTILVRSVLFSSVPATGLEKTDPKYIEALKMYYTTTLDYRRDILAIILTAFGAWVGAGAAYFFGRENLRESANSLLHLHQQMTGHDRLRKITVRDVALRNLDLTVTKDITLKEVFAKFKANQEKWFVAVNTEGKTIVLEEEALYLFEKKQLEALAAADPAATYASLKEKVEAITMDAVAKAAQANEELKKLTNRFITVKAGENVADVNGKMEQDKVYLALVVDEAGVYTHYFTTNDIRKALLRV